MQKFAVSFGGGFWQRPAALIKLALLSCAALLFTAASVQAQSAPVNDYFTNATVISGLSGSSSGNNVGATLQKGETSTIVTGDAGSQTVGESVWFEWTAPSSGNVTFDTLGSVGVDYNPMNTVLAGYTGFVLTKLQLVAANDNAYPGTVNSSVTFLATAGVTYFMAIYVDVGSNGVPGSYVLNWNEVPAPIGGQFQMTSPTYEYSLNDGNANFEDSRGAEEKAVPARVTLTRIGGSSGKVDMNYYVYGTYYTNYLFTNVYETNIFVSTVSSNDLPLGSTNYITSLYNSIETYENYNANGYFYTTRELSAFDSLTNNTGPGGMPVVPPPFYLTKGYYTNGLAYVTNMPVSLGYPVMLGTQSSVVVGPPINLGIWDPPPETNVVTNSDMSVTTTTTTYYYTNIYVTNLISTFLGNTFADTYPAMGSVTFNDFQMNEDISLTYANGSRDTAANPYLENVVVYVAATNCILDPGEDQTIPAPTLPAGRSTAQVTLLNTAGSPYLYGQDALTNAIINFDRYTIQCGKTVNNTTIAYVAVDVVGGDFTKTREAFYLIDYGTASDNYNGFTLQPGSDYARPDNALEYIASPDFTSSSVSPGVVTWAPYDSTPKYIAIPITQDQLVKFNRDLQIQLYLPNADSFQQTLNAFYGWNSTCDLTILYTTPAAGTCDTTYNADNQPGTSPPYDANPGANGVVYASVVQPTDGKTVIGGDFTGYNSESGANRNHIARLTTTGQLDATFSPGSGFDADVEALTLDTNENIIAVGEFHSYNGNLSKGIVRILPSGAIDSTFNPGLGANSTIWATCVQTNGQILIAGDFTTFNSTNRSYIARLNPDGSVDSSFDPGIGPNADIYSIAVQTNGQILIGGAFTQVDGTNLNYIARLNSDGSLDSTFNPGYGFGANNIVNCVALQSNGQILLGGLFTQVGNLGGEGLARLNTDGTVDTSFETGTGANDEVNTIHVDSDGTILIGGWFTAYNQTRRIGFSRILPTGQVDTSFMDTAYNQFAGVVNDYYDPNVNPPNPIYTLGIQPDGGIIVGGSFYQIGGGATRDDLHPRQNFARVYGGATPGPGNVELSLSTYTAESSSPQYFVQVDRTNGSLGAVSATVAAIPTGSGAGYAAYGVDYTYGLTSPIWGVSWSGGGGDTWMLQDGLIGTNNTEYAIDGTAYNDPNPVIINVVSNNNNNVSLQLAMTQPKGMDTFFLGGNSSASLAGFGSPSTAQGENIPLGVGLGVTEAPLTIVHDNPHDGTFNFSAAYYYVSEGSTATITVTRTGGTDNNVSVQYNTSNGTALSGTDYRTTTGTLSFGAGVSTASFNVSLINEGVGLTTDRVFNVSLTIAGGGAALGNLINAQVEIVNNNFSSGHAEFAYGNIAAGPPQTISFGTNENQTPLQVTVARLGGTAGLLSVHYATLDGTAKNGVNYVGATNVLTWTNNDASTRTISIPMLDDGVVTPNLTASIYLYGPTVNNTNAPKGLTSVLTNATLVISNIDSPGAVQFTASSYIVNENGGYAIIPIYRTGGTIGALSFNYFTTNGTAAAGVNYFTNSGTITLSAGQVSTNIIVGISNQSTGYGLPLNFNVVLTSPSASILGSITNAQVNISGSLAINNPPGQPTTTYSPSAGFNAPVFALALQTNGKLLAGGDFTTADGVPRNRIARLNADGTLDTSFSSYLPGFGANSTIRSLVVQDNGLILMGGLFTNYNSSTLNYIARLNVDGTIDPSFNIGAGADNPVYAVASTYVNGARTTVLGGAFTMINGYPLNSIARLLDNGTVDTTFNAGLGANATVYAVAVQTDGKILIGGDFTAVNGTNLNHIARLNQNGSVDTSFNPGTGPNDSVRTIAIQLDGNILIGGLFTNVNGAALNYIARLQANGSVDPGFNVGVGANAEVTAIAVQPDTRILVAGDFTLCSGVTRNRITRLNPDGTVDPTINFGTGADNFVAATVIESTGNIDLGGGFQNFNGAPYPYLVQVYGGSVAGSGAIQFSSSSYSVHEKGTNALISIIRTGGTSGTNIFVDFATSPGSAVPGTNYTTVVTNVDFPAGEVLETVAIPVFDDGIVTTNLTVSLTLTNPTAPAVIGDVPSATLSIINDDSSVSFSAATYTVAKNTPGGEAVIQVEREGSQAGTTTVNFTTGTGSATPGTDYTPVDETLTFEPGVSNLTVNVAINNNDIAEGNRTIPLQLSGSEGAYETSPSNAVLTIIDTVNLPGEFEFSATNYTVTEGGGSGVSPVLVTVNRTDGSSGIVSVKYTTLDGTAAYGTKYISTNGSLTFGDGVTSQSFYVQAINTTTAEGPEYLYVALSNPTGGASVLQTNATITILNTNIGIAFVMATNSYTEPYGQNPGIVTLNVVRFNNTNGTTTVGFYTTNDSAVLPANMAISGTNYVGTNGTLTFNPGDSIKAINIATLYDPAVTPDLYFNTVLTLPANSTAQLTPPSTTTVIDHDINVGISFVTPTNSVFKNAGYLPITVYISNTNEEPVSVNYSTGGGSAVPGVDYTTTSGVLTFTNGQILDTFTIPILPNNLVQSNKTFNITLSNPSGTGVITPYGTENITIVNTNTPYGLSFSTPVVLSGDWGSVSVNNTLGSPQIGDPTIAGNPPTAPVWFEWTAPLNGEVTVDTIGSVQTNGLKMDTVLAVYNGGSLTTLNQVAANDDLYPNYPETQINESAQNIYDTNYYSNTTNFLFGAIPFGVVETPITQPYGGPSGLRFNAVAGTTYYLAVDSKVTEGIISIPVPPYYALVENGLGTISLNWAYHPAGVFRFATEKVDETGLFGTNGNPLLLYQVSETESELENLSLVNLGPNSPAYISPVIDGGQAVTANDFDTTHGTYYSDDVHGLLVTITRVAGSTGRVSVDYTNVDGNLGMLTNGDVPAIAGTDYVPVGGTLIFDDFEMSKSIYVPIYYTGGRQPNKDFTVVLSNPQRDPLESSDVSAPRVDSIFGTVLCRILNCDIDPKGPSVNQITTTNTIIGTTNTVVTTSLSIVLAPTNAVFNFTKANYRVQRDEAKWFNGSVPVTLYVDRFGTNSGSVTLNWRIDNDFLDKNSPNDSDYTFPLSAGSDYAVPTPDDAAAVKGTNSDFAGVGGDSGSISFPGSGTANYRGSQPIEFNINDNNLTEFNRDVLVSIYGTDSQGNPLQVGMNDQAVVTILFDNTEPPAGSVDQLYNPDFASDLAFPTNGPNLGSSLINPGTELYSEVYSVNVLPSNGTTPGNQSLIAGAFTTYNDRNNTYSVNGIARLNYDGTLDTTFNSGSGVNVFPGGEFIRVADLTTAGQIMIGGDFSSYNGVQRNSIARLNANGSLDSTFNPGAGVNGTVWAMIMQPNGQVVIGGDFTSYNGQPANHIARVNMDGSLDTTFNAGTNFNAAVYALALETNEMIVAGGAFTAVGGVNGQNRIVRLNTNGVMDVTFNTITGPNAAVRSLAVQPDGSVLAGGEFTLVAGLSENYIVRFTPTGAVDSTFNAGTGTDGTVYDINDYLTTNSDGSTSTVIYLGGSFTTFNGTHRLGLARLYADGSLDTTFLDTAYNQFAGLSRIFYNDPPGTVYSSAVQPDGNVLIVGAFQEVGGGQADKNVRNYLEQERGLTGSYVNPDLWVSMGGGNIEPNSRDGVRNRGNVARLVGGATPGPGNISLASPAYAVNKTEALEPVTLVRTNGSLGYASANFAVIPGLATSGLDYSNSTVAPLYPIEWENVGPTRDHFDGLFGPAGEMEDKYGELVKYGFSGPASINVGIINDTANAGNLSATLQLANPVDVDQFYLGGQNIPVGVALGESVAPLTLIDNSHQDGVFGFATSSFTATNALATITIARTNSSIGNVQLNYQTVAAGSTAVNGVDYLATNGTVLFNAGQTSSTFPIIVLQNSSSSTIEKDVNLNLFNIQDLSQGDAVLGLTNAVLRIINPNFPGYINLTTNYYVANLTSGTISFTIARTVGSKGTLSVQYATYDETALNKVNYVGTTNSVSWSSGDVSAKTINVPLIPTNVVGSSLQFGVFIFNPTLNTTNTASLLGTLTNATMNIINNNSYGTFQFGAAQYRVNENGGYATLTVTRSGSALGSASVNYSTVNGPAVQGVNYMATSGTLNFTNGQLSSSFNVGIINDGVVDPPPASFYFNVDLSLPNSSVGYALGSTTNAVVQIVDAQTYNQPPGAIDPSFNPSLVINGSVLSLAQQADGQIVAGGLFTSVDGVALNHVARLNTDGSLDTSFMYDQAGADGYVNAVISQTDSRVLVGGQFANLDGTTRNGVGRLMTDGTLDTSFSPGSGADNSVFALAETFINGSRELYVGGAFSTFNGVSSPGVVRLFNNGSQDTGFSTGLGADGTVYSVAAYPTNAVDDNGDVLVGGGFTNFDNTIVGNLVRLNPNGSVDTNFVGVNSLANGTVRSIVIQADGEILIGGDFTLVDGIAANHLARLNPNGTLDTAFAGTVSPGVNGTVDAILEQPDNRIVVAGQFNQANGLNRNNLTRLLPSGAVDPTIDLGDGANGAVNAVVLQATNEFLVVGGAFTVFEDQPLQYIARLYGGSEVGSGQFSFSSANYQIDEDAGFATITIVRSGGSSGPTSNPSGEVYISFSTTNDTAVSGVNYTGVTNELLGFPVGQSFQTITIPVQDNGAVTPNLLVNLGLGIPTGSPAGLGDQPSAQLTIINDNSGVSFSQSTYSVPKDTVTGVANIGIERVGSTSGGGTVDFATDTNGTATVGVDYYPTNELVTFNPGQSEVFVQVPIINNTIPEGQRTIGMLLTNATGFVLTSPTNATLTIIDTVDAPGQLLFATNSYTILKANTNVILTVIRTNGASGSVSATYTTTAGTALPGLNYLNSSGTVTLGDGVTSQTIAIPILDNSLVQGTVNFTVTLSNPDGGATLETPTNAVVNIEDHNLGVSFQSATNYTTDTSGSAIVFVQRIGATNAAFSVGYNTTNITAIPGTNYTPVAGQLTFAPGQTLEAISIPVLYDAQITTDLFFGVNLVSLNNGVQLVAPTNALVVIHSANAGFSFTNATTSVLKNAGSIVIPVICSNPSVEPVIVNSNTIPLEVSYYTTNGTATGGIDYDSVSGTLVYTNGIGTNYITVPIINNGTLEGNRTFNVVLFNPTAPGELVAPSNQLVTIEDINSGVEFSSPTYTVLKTGIQATITVLRTDYTNSTVSVNYSATNGTAQANVNFVPTSGTLTFTNGVTQQQFNVQIISSTVVQPDLTVFLQLSSATNAELTYPSFSTLTIEDLSGSAVVPAGAVLVPSQSQSTNGIIYPGQVNTLDFAFRASSGTNVANLEATLLATNGVTPTNGSSTEVYGPLIVGGHSVAKPFTFLASGTNGQAIEATFRLLNVSTTGNPPVTNNLGTNTFTFTLGTWQNTFSNSTAIIMSAFQEANPYPSSINVSGLAGVILKTTVTFTNLTHSSPDAIEALVVAPNQQNTLLMNNVGGGNGIQNVTLTFDDAATNSLPGPTSSTPIATGTNKPTAFPTINSLP